MANSSAQRPLSFIERASQHFGTRATKFTLLFLRIYQTNMGPLLSTHTLKERCKERLVKFEKKLWNHYYHSPPDDHLRYARAKSKHPRYADTLLSRFLTRKTHRHLDAVRQIWHALETYESTWRRPPNKVMCERVREKLLKEFLLLFPHVEGLLCNDKYFRKAVLQRKKISMLLPHYTDGECEFIKNLPFITPRVREYIVKHIGSTNW